MYKKPIKDFNDASRPYLYTVGIAVGAPCPRADFSAVTDKMVSRIQAYAASSDFAEKVKLTADTGSLRRQGIFFLHAPARFAAEVRTMDGIRYVEPPAARKPQRCLRRRSQPHI
jgi:hypothetical protein